MQELLSAILPNANDATRFLTVKRICNLQYQQMINKQWLLGFLF